MMRDLSTDQKKIYQHYSRLGEELAKYVEKKSFQETVWKIITKEGIWRLPTAKQYGGDGLGWREGVIALSGFFNSYSSIELLPSLISQMTSLYLISSYGTDIIKKKYLPLLIRGEMAIVHISKKNQSISNKDKYINNNQMDINTSKHNDVFYIFEKNITHFSKENEIKESLLINKYKLIVNKTGAFRNEVQFPFFRMIC